MSKIFQSSGDFESFRRWYYYLNRKDEKNLIDREKLEQDSIVVSNWTGVKKYTVFQNHIKLHEYLFNISHQERCFFEILLPHISRKMYFDIDMDKSALISSLEKNEKDEFLQSHFISVIRKAIKILIPEIAEHGSILIFTSHTSKKLSYHIIIDGWYLQNYEECKVFYERFVEHIPEEWVDFFDETVYKKTQQFRIVWNHKYEKENTKRLNQELSYNFKIPSRYGSDKGKNLYILFSSLIGRTEKCKMLTGFASEKRQRGMLLSSGAASENDLEAVMNIFQQDSQFKKGPFDMISVVEENGNLIIPLKSHGSYECETCQRFHEAENPYLIVKGDEREIYFDCRRSTSFGGAGSFPKRKFIGKLGKVEGVEDQPTEVPAGTMLGVEENKVVAPKCEYKLEKPRKLSESKGSSPKRLSFLMGMKPIEVRKPTVNLNLKLRLYSK